MNEPKDETNRDSEEPKDLVALMKEMETNFHKGVDNSNTDYKSPGEYLRDYQENS